MTVIRLPSMVMGAPAPRWISRRSAASRSFPPIMRAYTSIVMLDTSWPSLPLHALRVDAVADQEGGLRVSQLVEVVADVEPPLAAALLGLLHPAETVLDEVALLPRREVVGVVEAEVAVRAHRGVRGLGEALNLHPPRLRAGGISGRSARRSNRVVGLFRTFVAVMSHLCRSNVAPWPRWHR